MTSRVGSADGGTSSDQLEGGGSIPTPALTKAHQRMIREQRAAEDADLNLFGRWWQSIDLDIGRARVREIGYATAEKVTLAYEWLGTMPTFILHSFGIYFDGHLGGVVIYSAEYAENLGRWDKYGFTGSICALSRGACTHWAHPHAGSKLIRRSMAMLPSRLEVVTATVDWEAGEVGTIYQACGFDYVGVLSGSGGIDNFILPDGRRISKRTALELYGGTANFETRYPGSIRVRSPHKGRYFGFRGRNTLRHREAIAHLIKPYPKRGTATP